MNIDSSILSEVINKRQSEYVVNALTETTDYFKNYILKRTLADILNEASRVCNTDFPVEMISEALEELKMYYIFNSPDIRDLVPISCYLAKDSYGMTCVEYYLLGMEVLQSEFFSDVKYYLFIVDSAFRRIEITNKFSTSHLIKDSSYKPKCLGDIMDGITANNRGDDIG
jgi:hypothetical protein